MRIYNYDRGLRTRVAAMAIAMLIVSACSANNSTPAPVATPSSPTASPSAIVLAATPTDTPAPSGLYTRPSTVAQPMFVETRGAAAGTTEPVTVTIAAAGDIACDPKQNVGTPKDCDQAATADLLGQLHPTAVLTLGDNQYEDNAYQAYLDVYDKTWGAYKDITFPTIGNHEYLTQDAAGYFKYFGFPAYYSFDLGNWHIVSLNSECHFVGGCNKNSPQERWFLADLAAHPNLCTMVMWHEPRWSSGEHQDATQMDTIWKDLVAANVDVVLTGHNHDYERFQPLNAAGRPDPKGTPEFVVGTGGKNHYGFVVPPLPGEVVRDQNSFGVISMTLTSDGYSWRFVDAPGYTFTDTGTATCH